MRSAIHTPVTPAEWRKRVIWLSIPIILSNITVPLVGIVDTAVMGRMATPDYLSATAIGATLFSSIFWIFGFLRMGTSGLVAQAIGADEPERARRTIVRAMAMSALLGMLIILTGKLWLAGGIWSMQPPENVTRLLVEYVYIRQWAAPATLGLYTIIGALIGLQRMRSVFFLQLLLNLLNIALTLWFFNNTDWDIAGVAVATVIAEYVTLAAGLWVLWPTLGIDQRHSTQPISPHTRRRSTPLTAWRPPGWLFDRRALSQFIVISGNLFVRTLGLTFAYYWLMILSTAQGVKILAVNAILLQMLHFMAHGLDGISNAAETLAGHAYGKRDPATLASAINASVFWGVIFAVVFSLAYWVFGGMIFSSMTSLPEIQQAAHQWLPWIALSPLIGVGSFLLDGIFTGTTHTREMRNGMVISVVLFLAASYVLIPSFGNHGLWASYYVLMTSRAITLLLWYPRILESTKQRAV